MSDLLKNPAILREIIMDHYQYPRNHELMNQEEYRQIHMASESCIDDIYVEAKINNQMIEDVRFDGVACTLGTASTSIMSELLKGKTIAEAREIVNEYYKMIDGKEYDEDMLQEAVAFQNVGKQANRIKCATIGWKGMEELMNESEKEHDQ